MNHSGKIKVEKMHKYTKKIYKYKDRIFTFSIKGVTPLNSTGEKRKIVSDTFLNIYREWAKLPNREDYRIKGITR